MKWFKHYTNSSKGEIIQVLAADFGMAKAYGLYFLLVEYFADKWDGCGATTFVVSSRKLRGLLELKHQKLLTLLVCMQDQGKMTFTENGKLITIEFPKLVEVMNKDALPSNIRPARIRPDGTPRPREDKEEDKDTDKEATACVFGFEILWDRYRRQEGKAAGMKQCVAEIVTQQDFEDLSKAIENYNAYLTSSSIEGRYIKKFSTFMETWREWVNRSEMDESERMFKMLQENEDKNGLKIIR